MNSRQYLFIVTFTLLASLAFRSYADVETEKKHIGNICYAELVPYPDDK